MTNKTISGGVVHKVPEDLHKALVSDSKARAAWESLTPLARNEWICWTTFVKQDKTRADHVKRTVRELKEGKRRPCCWLGCPHRTDKKISPSVQYVLGRRSKRLFLFHSHVRHKEGERRGDKAPKHSRKSGISYI